MQDAELIGSHLQSVIHLQRWADFSPYGITNVEAGQRDADVRLLPWRLPEVKSRLTPLQNRPGTGSNTNDYPGLRGRPGTGAGRIDVESERPAEPDQDQRPKLKRRPQPQDDRR
jgi:hypothetical protein